jgi:hypothetical protein
VAIGRPRRGGEDDRKHSNDGDQVAHGRRSMPETADQFKASRHPAVQDKDFHWIIRSAERASVRARRGEEHG